jgi:outer membrane protein assembly factor BamB
MNVRIQVSCVECESQFFLEESLRGKSVKCPVCAEIFTVPVVQTLGEQPEPTPENSPQSAANFSSPSVAEEGPAQMMDWSETLSEVPTSPPKTRPKTTFTEEPAIETEWRPDIESPPPAKSLTSLSEEPISITEYTAEDTPPAIDSPFAPPSSKKGKTYSKLILMFLLVILMGITATGGYLFWKYQQGAPNRLWADAQEAYSKGQFEQSRKLYNDFVVNYPNDPRAEEGRFFVELSALRGVIGSVLAKNDPNPGLIRWREFLKIVQTPEMAPFVNPSRFGVDVWQTGEKLLEDLIQKGEEVFHPDQPQDSEKWSKEIETVLREQEPFRPKEVPPSDLFKDRLTQLKGKITGAYARLQNLNQLQELLKEVDENTLSQARDFVALRQLNNDPSAQQLIETAEKQLQGKVTIEVLEQPIAAVPFVPLNSGGIYFAPRIEGGQRAGEGPGQVWFACAKGILYAFEENGGRSLWACRVGADHEFIPPVSGNLALVVEPSRTGLGLSGRDLRTGSIVWHVPLKGEVVAAPPVFFGTYAYVLMRDAKGTIYEIDTEVGEILAQFELGRRSGPSLAISPDGRLYIPAESQGIAVIDVNARKPDGNRAKPNYLGTMRTQHLPSSLLFAPQFVPSPLGASSLLLVIEKINARRSKLKLYRLGEEPSQAQLLSEYVVTGWLTSPPKSDGETLAFATDQGELHVLGLNLVGNADRPLFKIGTYRVGPPDTGRAFIAQMDEAGLWVCAGGNLQYFRQGLNLEEGFQIQPRPNPLPIGEPLQEAQLGLRKNRFLMVSHSDELTTLAFAVDSVTGNILWRKMLGTSLIGEPLVQGDQITVQDQNGGLYRLNASQPLESQELVTGEALMLAPPSPKFRAFDELLQIDSNSFLALAYSADEKNKRLLIHHFKENQIHQRTVPLTSEPLGSSSLSGPMLYLPLKDGTVARINWSEGNQLEIGPIWRNEKAKQLGQMIHLNENEFFVFDGFKTITRYHWKNELNVVGKLELPVIPTGLIRLIQGTPNQLLVPTGSTLTLWNADTLVKTALRTWTLPATIRYSQIHVNSRNKPRILTMSDRLSYLNPEQNEKLWEIPVPKGDTPENPKFQDDDIIWPFRSGELRVIDSETGEASIIKFKNEKDISSIRSVITKNKIRMNIYDDGTIYFHHLDSKEKNEIEPKK